MACYSASRPRGQLMVEMKDVLIPISALPQGVYWVSSTSSSEIHMEIRAWVRELQLGGRGEDEEAEVRTGGKSFLVTFLEVAERIRRDVWRLLGVVPSPGQALGASGEGP